MKYPEEIRKSIQDGFESRMQAANKAYLTREKEEDKYKSAIESCGKFLDFLEESDSSKIISALNNEENNEVASNIISSFKQQRNTRLFSGYEHLLGSHKAVLEIAASNSKLNLETNIDKKDEYTASIKELDKAELHQMHSNHKEMLILLEHAKTAGASDFFEKMELMLMRLLIFIKRL
ncbi:MAG: hypothetical protein SFT93_05075 [Rickettsiaceae bacterium]|nr:hypothetical protein [Rickettsiaceae bacterium]